MARQYRTRRVGILVSQIDNRARSADNEKIRFHLSTLAGRRKGRWTGRFSQHNCPSDVSRFFLFQQVERVLPVAGELERNEFSYRLTKQVYQRISDGHLWFSIFSRPPANKFTRVQRCTCCFILLFVSMFFNIMYYGLSTDADKNGSNNERASLAFGPLYISVQQVCH